MMDFTLQRAILTFRHQQFSLKDSISVRPSGITTQEFIKANKLPDLGNYSGPKLKKSLPKDSIKQKVDSADKKPRSKSVYQKNKNTLTAPLAANRPERREDE